MMKALALSSRLCASKEAGLAGILELKEGAPLCL